MNKQQIITNAREALEVLNPANYSDPDDVGGYVMDSLGMITKAIRDLLSLIDGEKHPQVYDYMGENERLRKALFAERDFRYGIAEIYPEWKNNKIFKKVDKLTEQAFTNKEGEI